MRNSERVIVMLVHGLNLKYPPALSDRIIDDLGADSLDCIEMLMWMEDEFGFQIADADAAHLYTVDDVVEMVDRRTGHAQAT